MFVFRCAELEKEVAALKEKIHHLDDMLKSQQRKVRHMIEQVCSKAGGLVWQGEHAYTRVRVQNC